MSTEPERRHRVYAHRDKVNGVEMTATTYPYGGGLPGRGMQVTLIRDLTVLSVRLPAEQAIALARAIAAEFADVDQSPLRPHEVASMFRVDAKTLKRWAKSGRIPSMRTLGGHRRYRLADVLAAMETEGGDG